MTRYASRVCARCTTHCAGNLKHTDCFLSPPLVGSCGLFVVVMYRDLERDQFDHLMSTT